MGCSGGQEGSRVKGGPSRGCQGGGRGLLPQQPSSHEQGLGVQRCRGAGRPGGAPRGSNKLGGGAAGRFCAEMGAVVEGGDRSHSHQEPAPLASIRCMASRLHLALLLENHTWMVVSGSCVVAANRRRVLLSGYCPLWNSSSRALHCCWDSTVLLRCLLRRGGVPGGVPGGVLGGVRGSAAVMGAGMEGEG